MPCKNHIAWTYNGTKIRLYTMVFGYFQIFSMDISLDLEFYLWIFGISEFLYFRDKVEVETRVYIHTQIYKNTK